MTKKQKDMAKLLLDIQKALKTMDTSSLTDSDKIIRDYFLSFQMPGKNT